MKLTVFSDGGARGNPGPAAWGVVVKDSAGQTLEAFGKYIGETTNNQAEYRGLIAALEAGARHEATELECVLDSELLVKQMRQEYRVKNADLQPLFLRAWNLAAGFKKVSYRHVPRAQNKEADAEVNRALDAMLN